ncbi:DUF2147 domain-containing protein [Nonlabens marinus]|uniref:DUF2147 domain-containing protein n=1 Tax=Nonlabens marinus S1-08 TaxID=1454201 RepID=W8VST3_9FLAO|nr:DUF2147 domain-containing protein [Nonlabens marinus]BAO56485.1 hypothetical protein NMS_2476 [Nonlabens marinus S1-08]
MKNIAIMMLVFFAFAKAYSQDVTGKWKTIDENSGEVKSHVEIYKKGDSYYGKVLKVLAKDAPENPKCVECEGKLKDQPIEGMVIIKDLKKQGKMYKEGTVIDPENGKSYDCKIWLNEDNPDVLMVRGYVLFLYRTQTWERL